MSAKNVSHTEDKDLLERYYTDHNNQWLGILLPRYTMLLLGVCMKYLKNEEDAKDAVQQIFLKVIHELPKYKVEYFKSWIFMIAKNHCLMQLRTNNIRPLEIDEKRDTSKNEPDENEELLKKELTLNELENALREISAEQRECVNLFYMQKRSYLEITGITGFSLLQVKSFIQNGKRNLKQILLKKGFIATDK